MVGSSVRRGVLFMQILGPGTGILSFIPIIISAYRDFQVLTAVHGEPKKTMSVSLGLTPVKPRCFSF